MRTSLPRKAKQNSEQARKERERITKKRRSRTVGAPANNPRTSSRSRAPSTSPSPPSPPTSSTVATKRGRQSSGKTDESRKKHPRNGDSVREDDRQTEDDVNKNANNRTETGAKEDSQSEIDYAGSADHGDSYEEFSPPPPPGLTTPARQQIHFQQSNFVSNCTASVECGGRAPVGDEVQTEEELEEFSAQSKVRQWLQNENPSHPDQNRNCLMSSSSQSREVRRVLASNEIIDSAALISKPQEGNALDPDGQEPLPKQTDNTAAMPVSPTPLPEVIYVEQSTKAPVKVRCGTGDNMFVYADSGSSVRINGTLISSRMLKKLLEVSTIQIASHGRQIPVVKQEEFEVITIESSDEETSENEGCSEGRQATGRRLSSDTDLAQIETNGVATRASGTKKVHDLPSLFARASLDEWKKFINNVEDSEDADDNTQFEWAFKTLSPHQQHAVFNSGDNCEFVTEVELVLEGGVLIEVAGKEELQRRAEKCHNDAGVVAWKLRLFTPEKPKGYDVVVIATDVIHSGAFAIHEDKIFKLASEYSQQKKIPRAIIFYISGARIGLGDLHLQDSGLIAGETSATYNEVPTYCLVTGNAVGASTAQLGGIQSMHKKGVTHSVVNDKLEGISKIVQWMGYLPKQTENYPFHEKFGLDQKPRLVDFTIEPNEPYDIRNLIDSKLSDMTSGICDTNSFDEIMEGWAKTIVAGRARIGGIPIGVVSSELRATSVSPGDPAAPNSESVEMQQAGEVCYSESALKTAEVIKAFNREGLPLLFIASLHGISGGQKDMYGIFEFGAQIVDALKQYKQSVVIYIPEKGELRGGAWAVFDSKINPGLITTVADEEYMGGILEPNAIVEFNLRQEVTKKWDKKWSDEITNNGADTEEAKYFSNVIKKRSAELNARMHRKGAVQHVTDLANCRNLFILIFSLEYTKVHLAKEYKSVARDVTLIDSYKWVQDQLEAYNPGFTSRSPFEQAGVVEKFVSEGKFFENVNMVHEDSVERGNLSMPPDVRERLI